MKADMRKVALGIIAVSGITLVSGIADAGVDTGYEDAPIAVVSPASSSPGQRVAVAVEPCLSGEEVDFTFEGVTKTETCESSRIATTSFTAPAAPGEYPGTATLKGYQNGIAANGFVGFGFLRGEGGELPERPLVVPFTVVVADTTTTTTTIAGTTTTVAGATTTVAGATTTLGDTIAPTTNPSGQLPATGSSGTNSTSNIALGLFAVGLGLLVVSQVRRRQASA
jgi:hypothetical protein